MSKLTYLLACLEVSQEMANREVGSQSKLRIWMDLEEFMDHVPLAKRMSDVKEQEIMGTQDY